MTLTTPTKDMKRALTLVAGYFLAVVLSAYVYGVWITYTKTPMTVSGPVSRIDQQGRLMAVETAPYRAIEFSIPNRFMPLVGDLVRGDEVEVVLGYAPDFLMPICRTYRLQELQVVSKGGGEQQWVLWSLKMKLTDPALPFYIWISTTPIEARERGYGFRASVVLTGATSTKAAEQWADDFAERTILDQQKEQRLTERRLVELSDRLISGRGSELIVWERLTQAVQQVTIDQKHHDELGSQTVLFGKPNADDETPLLEGWDQPDRYRTQLPEVLAARLNWNESYPGFYIFHNRERGVIVEAANGYLANIPFIRERHEHQLIAPETFIDFCPSIERYDSGRP